HFLEQPAAQQRHRPAAALGAVVVGPLPRLALETAGRLGLGKERARTFPLQPLHFRRELLLQFRKPPPGRPLASGHVGLSHGKPLCPRYKLNAKLPCAKAMSETPCPRRRRIGRFAYALGAQEGTLPKGEGKVKFNLLSRIATII